MRAMCEELSGTDLGALARQTDDFLERSEAGYQELVEPQLRKPAGAGLRRAAALRPGRLLPRARRWTPTSRASGSCRRSRRRWPGWASTWARSPGSRSTPSARPKKSPRAFCSPVRVPDEVYLVIAPVGGREDFAALFHEAGHTEHYAHVDSSLPVEDRYLGDNSITEGFAFLFEHLMSNPEWLRRRMGIEDPSRDRGARARPPTSCSCAATRPSWRTSWSCTAAGPSTGSTPSTRAGCPTRVRVDWPAVSWLADVDPFFYAARYLRAWALETHLRAALVERFGAAWFEEPGRRRVPARPVERGPGPRRRRGHPRPARAVRARLRRAGPGLTPRPTPGATRASPPRAQHRLAVGVAALVVADLAQLGRAQVGQPALHLGHRQVVEAR